MKVIAESDPAAVQEEGDSEVTPMPTDPQVGEEEAEDEPEEGESEEGEESDEEGDEESEDSEGEEGDEDTEDEPGGLDITVEGQEPPPKTSKSNRIKQLREEYRASRARISELERLVAERAGNTAQPAVADPGAKPTLESCGYDTEEFATKLDAWHVASKHYEVVKEKAQKEAQEASQEWEGRKENYRRSRTEILKQVPNYEEAEAKVQGMFNDVQQGVILHVAKDPALVIAALGKYPKLAQDLAAKKDLTKFAAEIGRLETLVKKPGKGKTSIPPPERPVRGTGSVSGSGDSQLERLRARAEKTGDYTDVVAYQKKKASK